MDAPFQQAILTSKLPRHRSGGLQIPLQSNLWIPATDAAFWPSEYQLKENSQLPGCCQLFLVKCFFCIPHWYTIYVQQWHAPTALAKTDKTIASVTLGWNFMFLPVNVRGLEQTAPSYTNYLACQHEESFLNTAIIYTHVVFPSILWTWPHLPELCNTTVALTFNASV